MIFTVYFSGHAKPPKITANPLYHDAPVDMPSPPCDGQGRALPMMFHMSHQMMSSRWGPHTLHSGYPL
jgi:hypothetical protein